MDITPAVQAASDRIAAAARNQDYGSAGDELMRSVVAALGAEISPGGLLIGRSGSPMAVHEAVSNIDGVMAALVAAGGLRGAHAHYVYDREREVLHVHAATAMHAPAEYADVNLQMPEDPFR